MLLDCAKNIFNRITLKPFFSKLFHTTLSAEWSAASKKTISCFCSKWSEWSFAQLLCPTCRDFCGRIHIQVTPSKCDGLPFLSSVNVWAAIQTSVSPSGSSFHIPMQTVSQWEIGIWIPENSRLSNWNVLSVLSFEVVETKGDGMTSLFFCCIYKRITACTDTGGKNRRAPYASDF